MVRFVILHVHVHLHLHSTTPQSACMHDAHAHLHLHTFAYICTHMHAGVCKWPWEVPVGQVLVEGDISQTAQVRDEPGSGGVRVGQTRSDLDCRVVATSRRVAPTECDSRLPLFGRGSTCRLRLLDSWPPPGSGVVFDSSRGSTRVSRPVAPTESGSSDIRRT